MEAQINEDGFSTIRTGKHIEEMTMDEVQQIEKHIQNKISSLLSMEGFDPENLNHKVQMKELKADRDRIRQRKSTFSTNTSDPQADSTSDAKNPTVDDPRKVQQDLIEKQMNDFVPRNNNSHSLNEGVIEGDFSKVDSPTKSNLPPAEERLPAVVEEPQAKLPPVTDPPPPPNGDGPSKANGAGASEHLPAKIPPKGPTPSDVAKKSKLLSGRNLLGGAFVGYDAYSRIKDGENAAVAIGKAVVTNALFAALPGGIVGGLAIGGGVMVASMAPDLYDAVEAKKADLSRKSDSFQTSFEESEGQIANRQQGMQQQQQAEQYALDRMRRHAQGAHSTY